jgi:hypothetical protein
MTAHEVIAVHEIPTAPLSVPPSPRPGRVSGLQDDPESVSVMLTYVFV